MHLPYVLRIVEFDGVPTTVTFRVPDHVATCQTNLLGETTQQLTVKAIDSQWSKIQVSLRAYEIETTYTDLVHGHKTPTTLMNIVQIEQLSTV